MQNSTLMYDTGIYMAHVQIAFKMWIQQKVTY